MMSGHSAKQSDLGRSASLYSDFSQTSSQNWCFFLRFLSPDFFWLKKSASFTNKKVDPFWATADGPCEPGRWFIGSFIISRMCVSCDWGLRQQQNQMN